MKLQDFRKFLTTQPIQPARTTLIVPAFSLAVPVWAGSSVILLEFALGNTDNFSIKLPVDVFGENFVPAVRWLSDDGANVYRFLFWEDDDMVLFYPIYNGEAIGAAGVIEIWSVNRVLAPVLAADEILEASVLVFPEVCGPCCEQPSASQILAVREPTIINPYAYCDPFCIPLSV